jgi:signal transduction histidine kinase
MSLQARLILAFAILIVAVAGLLSYFHVSNANRLLAEIGDNLQEIGNTVHMSSQKLSAEKGPDREMLERFVNETAAQKNVREVHVISSQQEIVASSNPSKVGHKAKLTGKEMAKLTGKEIVIREEIGDTDTAAGHNLRYEVRVPIMKDQRVIGVVQTSIVLRDFRALVQEALVRNLVIALVALLLAFVASSYLLHLLNQPLRTLSTASAKVAGGDLGLRLPILTRNDEVTRLFASFNAMVERLAERKALEDKLRQLERHSLVAEMSASLAHEIRNPLNLINLTAGHLGGAFAPADPEKRADYEELMESLQAEVRHLNQVVHHFLSVSRPGRLRQESFALREILEEAQVLLRPQFSAKGLEIVNRVPDSVQLHADKEQTRLLFLNLLLNAAEAAPEKGRIEVEASSAAAMPLPESGSRSWVDVRVMDNGAGIQADDLDRVFDAYFTRKESGVGLGLALVRRIAEEHGGSVCVSNRPQGGACFEVRLSGRV